jgi:hypothetical protein
VTAAEPLARARALADALEAAGLDRGVGKIRASSTCNSRGEALEWCRGAVEEALPAIEAADPGLAAEARALVGAIDDVLAPWREGAPDELPALTAALEEVRDAESFERFAAVLLADLEQNGIWWTNGDLPSYLSALAATAADRGDEGLSWRALATLLDRARVYE